jgi:hypothetical protein
MTTGIIRIPNRIPHPRGEKGFHMSFKSNLIHAGALGAVVTAITAGAAFAAVATSSVNVRSGPGTGYGILDQLYPGEHVAVTDRAGGWCEVARPGPNGWVSCAYLAGGYSGPRRFNRYDGPGYYDNGPDYYDNGASITLSLGTSPHHHMPPPPPPPYGFPGHDPWWY